MVKLARVPGLLAHLSGGWPEPARGREALHQGIGSFVPWCAMLDDVLSGACLSDENARDAGKPQESERKGGQKGQKPKTRKQRRKSCGAGRG